MDNNKNNDKRAKKKNALATVPGVVAVDDADRTFVRRGKVLNAQKEQEALADGTSSEQHISKPKSASESDSENTEIDRKVGWRSREVKRTKKKNALATVPGVAAMDDADRTFVRRGKILAAQIEQEALADETSSLQPPDIYKDLSHDVRVRRADGMAARIQHAQYRADAARLRNKASLENEEKVAEDDGSFAAPGTVEFVQNNSEVSHGCITLPKNDQKGSSLI